MLIDHQPLSWYVERFRSGPFSLTKHSDASLYCMQGREGGDCNGCRYSPELREGLLKSIKVRPRYVNGIQRLTDRDNSAFDLLLDQSGIVYPTWLDTGIVPRSIIDGTLYPLIEAIRSLPKVVIVSNQKVINDVPKILPTVSFAIVVPLSNALDVRDHVYQEVRKFGPAAYLFSCGMAATVFVSELHGTIPGASFVDLGHIWDPFLGIMSRNYMKDLTPAHFARNLRP